MTLEPITGKVLRIFPQDTNTDEVISGKYKYDELDLSKLAFHTFESITNATTGEEYGFSPIPKFMQELLESGGLLKYLKEKGGYE